MFKKTADLVKMAPLTVKITKEYEDYWFALAAGAARLIPWWLALRPGIKPLLRHVPISFRIKT